MKSMSLIKTSLLGLIAISFKIISGLAINKIIAVYLGPSGLALVGQFQNFFQIIMTLAQGAINTGVIKYTSEYGRNSPQIPQLFSAAARISLICSIIISVILILFNTLISKIVLKTDCYGFVFTILGITLFLSVIGTLLLSILNGLKEVKSYVQVNVFQSIYSVVFTGILINIFGLKGALIGLATNQAFIIIFIIYLLRNHDLIKIKYFIQKVNKSEVIKLWKFALMAIVYAITTPFTNFFLRNYIGQNLGWDNAGYWQAVWNISNLFLVLMNTTLGIYYLPRLSEITDKQLLKIELLNGYRIIMPVVVLSAFCIFCLKDYIVPLLFSTNFSSSKKLFLFQLIGDIIKLASWLLSYLMSIRVMVKAFIITEIFYSCSFIVLSVVLIKACGLIGVTYAYSLNYLFYIINIYIITRKIWHE